MGIQINGNTDTISALDGSWTSDSATHFTGKVSIGGTLTYEDVTNIDSVGIVTARNGIEIGGQGTNKSILFHEANNSPSNGDSAGEIKWASRVDKTVTAQIKAAAFNNNNGTDGVLTFWTANDTSSGDSANHLKETFRIDQLGRTLIGNQRTVSDLGYYDDLTINNSNAASGSAGSAGITLVAGDSAWCGLNFGRSGDMDEGHIRYDNTNNAMIFGAGNGGEKLRIDSSGRLLLGRTSGSFAIDLQTGSDSTFRMRNSGETGHGSHDAKIVAGGSYYQNPNIVGSTIKFSTYNGSAEAERARITSGGSLIVGNQTSTSYKLCVSEAAHTRVEVISTSNNSAGAWFKVYNGGSLTSQSTIRTSGGSLQVYTGTSSEAERLRIDSAGHVMIGTTTEGFATYGDQFTIANSGHCGMTIRSGTSSDGNIYFSDGTSGADEVRGFVEYNHSSNFMNLGTDGGWKVRINSTGKVGIGIDPTARLHVNGLSTDGNIILARCADSNGLSSLNLLVEGTTGNSRILFSDTAAPTGDAWISYGHSDRALTFTTAGTGNERLRIDSSGRVLINRNASRAISGDNAKLQIENPSSGLLSLLRTSNDNGAAWLAIAKSRSAAGAVCQAGDQIGGIAFTPHDGTDLNHHAAEIRAYVDTGIGGNDTPGYLTFHTNSGATTTSERLRITSAGHVQVRSTQSATTGGAPLYIGVTGKSSITYNGGSDDTACVRIEDEGGTNSYYHGLELRTKQGGDVRIYAQDKGNDVADLVFAIDNSGIAERFRIDSNGRVLMGTQKTYGSASYYDDITINNSNGSGESGGTGITLISSSNSWNSIYFGDANNHGIGGIKYDHNTDSMRLVVNAVDPAVHIDSNSKVGLNGIYASSYYSTYNNLVIGKTNDSSGMTIVSGTSSSGYITWADGTSGADQYRGRLFYSHSDNGFRFRCDGLSNDIFKIYSSQVHITGTSDGVLNLDTSSSNGTFIRFKQSGTTKHWIGCAAGLGGYGDNDDLTVLATDNIIWATNSAQRMRLTSGGNLKLGGHTSGSTTGGEDKINIKGDGAQFIYIGSNDASGAGVYFDGDSNGDMSGSDYARIMHNTDGYLQLDNWKSGGGHRFAIGGNTRLEINSAGGIHGSSTDSTTVKLALSNQDSGNQAFSHRGNRTLHSNGTGWGSDDGKDPIIVCSVANRGGNSDLGDSIGLLLHSESQDNNDFSPMVAFSSRSNSGSYNSIYGAIIGQRTGQGTDSNWNAGALHFFTAPAGSGAYMNATADMSIDSEGHVLTPRNSRFYALSNSGGSDTGTNDDGYILSAQFETEFVDSNGDYNTSNGRFTAPVDGNYEFHAAALLRAMSGSGSGELTFYKNGSNMSDRSFGYSHIGSGGSGSDHDHHHIHVIVTLSAGDYVDFRVHDLNSSLDYYFSQGLGYFSGKLLG